MNNRIDNKFRLVTLLLLFTVGLAVIATTGCSRDPNVRKQKYLESGQRFLAKNKYREAIIQFSNALQVDSRCAAAHHQMAVAYLKMDAWNAAYNEFRRTVELDPADLDAHVQIGNLLLAAGRLDEAEETSNFTLRREPNRADALALSGKLLAARHHYPEAIEQLERALASKGDDAVLHEDLAAVLANTTDHPRAEAELRKAIVLAPASEVPHLLLASLHERDQRWNDAEEDFKTAISIAPRDLGIRKTLASFYMSRNAPEKAEQVVRTAEKELSSTPAAASVVGEFFVVREDTERAMAELRRSMKENPKNASGARKLLAHLLLDRSRLDEAQPLIDEAVKANSNDPEVQALQASLLYRRGRVADALPLMQLAVKNAPENAGAHHQLALIFMARQDITNAEQQWREALSLSPGFMPALEALAGLAMSRGDAAQLNQLAEAAISTHPMDPSGYMWRATASYNRKKFTKAEADLMRAVQVAPDSASARNKLAGLRVAQRRFPEADQMFESVLSSEPRNAEALRGLVASYAAQKMPWARLVARVNAQITKQPDCGDFYVIRAALQADLKDTVGAEASVLKALQLNASDENAAILYARLAIQSGTVEKGIAVWENRINHHPDDVRAYVLLGTLEEARQKPQRAQQRYEAALRLKPDQPMAANNLAYLMLSTGQNVDTALSLAQIARQGLPDSPNAADTLAWAYYKKGVYRLATDLLEQAIKISPENATYHYHAGLAYQKLADHSKARAHLQRALKLAPNAPAAGKIRKALSDFERG